MPTRNKPTARQSDINRQEHQDSSSIPKTKENIPEQQVSEETERIIKNTTIKRHKAIKELANR